MKSSRLFLCALAILCFHSQGHVEARCSVKTLQSVSSSANKIFEKGLRDLIINVAREKGIQLRSTRVELVKTFSDFNIYMIEGLVFRYRVTAVTKNGTAIRLSKLSDDDQNLRYFDIWTVPDEYTAVPGSEGSRLLCNVSINGSGVLQLVNDKNGAAFAETVNQDLLNNRHEIQIPVTL